tara:strand:- start:3506 stop:3967 length:462 start_codon:yes stop_codon:yes gene_type:complete
MVVPVPEEKKGGLFSKKAAPKPMGPDPELLKDIAQVTRRLRVMEEQYTNMRRRVTVLDQNMLSHGKKLKEEVNIVNTDFNEAKKLIKDVEDKLILVIKELKRTANKQDVLVLQKYINLWEPVNFVTRTEAEKMIKEAINDHKTASSHSNITKK